MTSKFIIPYMTKKSSISYTLNEFPLEVLYSRAQSPSITNKYKVDLLSQRRPLHSCPNIEI